MKRKLEEWKALGVDTDGAVRRFAGNSSLYEKFLLKFLRDENYAKAERALSEKNWEQLFVSVHTLKGVSGNLGLNEIYAVCSQIVADLRSGGREAAAAAFPQLRDAYFRICSALAEEEEK